MGSFLTNNSYRFFFVNDNVRTEFNPTGTISVSWELEDGTFFYKETIGAFTVSGVDYNYLKAIETAGEVCKALFVEVERLCDKQWSVYASAKFTLQDCQFNNSKCNIKVNPEASGGGQCLIDSAGNQLDMFEEVDVIIPGADGAAEMSDAKAPNPDTLGYDNGRIFFYNAAALEPILIRPQFLDAGGNPATTGTPTVSPTVDELMSAGVIGNDEREFIRISRVGVVQTGILTPQYIIYVAWAYRRTLIKVGGECQPTPKGYTLVNGVGPSCVFQKKPTDSDMSLNDAGATTFGDCSVISPPGAPHDVVYSGAEVVPGYASGFCTYVLHKDQQYVYDTLSLEGALSVFTDKCGIPSIISDFFQINPENPDTINYVTGDTTHTNDIRFIQRSNAIFPVISNARTGLLSWTDLTDQLKESFQAFYTIDVDGNLRYEHVSFFENVIIGLDLTVGKFSKFTNQEINYSYKKSLLPFIEKISDDGNHINFNWDIQTIKYIDPNGDKLNCVGVSTIDRSFGIFTSDLDYYAEYPTNIPRSGWVMVACTTGGGNAYIIPFDNLLNGHMSIKRLVINYYKHGRSALLGQINGVNVTFESYVRLKEDDLGVVICCDDDFDPRDNVLTPNGIGRVISAEHDLKTNKLTLKNEY